MIKNVLFLCVGNICRSPMAEGLFRLALPDLAVCSAGLDPLTGYPADPLSMRLMEERGIDISGHRAQPLAGWMVSEADLILTMDMAQAHYMTQRYPAARGKVGRLGAGGGYDIPDPYRQGLPAFRHSCELIARGVDDLVVRVAPTILETAPAARHGIAIAQRPFVPANISYTY